MGKRNPSRFIKSCLIFDLMWIYENGRKTDDIGEA
jgi:hypothetical protein